MAIDKTKYKNVILYLANQIDGEIHGKKKLAKLLYYVDFDSFEKTEKAVTNDVYRAFPMGPLPQCMDEVIYEMTKEGVLGITHYQINPSYNPTEVYKSLVDADVSVFSDDELFILNRVVKKYGELNGKQLEDLTHAEAPYIGTDLKEEITYELAFYRDTDFEND